TLSLLAAVLMAYRGHAIARVLLAQAAVFAALVMLGAVVGPLWQDLLPAVRLLAPLQLALGAASGLAAVEALRVGLFGNHAAPRGVRYAIGVAAATVVAIVAVSAHRTAAARISTVDNFPEMYPRELDDLLNVLATLPPG